MSTSVRSSSDRTLARLAERAERYANTRLDDDQARSEVELVTFTSAGHLFAVRLDQVESIARLTGLTKVPGAPPFVLGLVRLRRGFVTLLDPRELLLSGRSGLSDATKVVAIRVDGRVLGLAAAEVHDVVFIAQKEFDSARLVGDGLTRAVTIGDTSVALIDAAALAHDIRLGSAPAGPNNT